MGQTLTSHLFPKRVNSTALTRGPSPEAMLLTTALVVYKELQKNDQSSRYAESTVSCQLALGGRHEHDEGIQDQANLEGPRQKVLT